MTDITIAYEPFADADTRRFITEGVDMFNVAATGLGDYAPVNVVLRSAHGDIHGGALGFVWGRWLQVTALWVSSSLRGQGHGRGLVAAIEAHALRHGAVGVALETYSFQARDFYEKQGYGVCGQIEDYPPGHIKYFLKKPLAAG
ncbi:GNAT family N-acetyltransferase [Asticcacaulis solisilvae]|uniref:GNAT family N-acetyltransferase n=1 Tax=Asticcacaulis solisilvae TaxID=1217274 RepID=UPI003FD85570